MKEKEELSEEFLSQLTPLERRFITSWRDLRETDEFQETIRSIKEDKDLKLDK